MKKWMVIPIIVILVLGTIANGAFYLQEGSKLKDAEAEIARLRGDISALEGGLLALEGDVSNLEGGVSAMGGDVSAVEGDVSTLKGDVSAVEGDVSTLQGDVSAVEGEVSTLEGNISTLEAELLGADTYSLQELVALLEPSVVRIATNMGSGTGVIITNTGWVLTNAHVLQQARSIEITLADGTAYSGVMLHNVYDLLDLAMVKIDSNRTDFPEAALGLSADIAVGEGVLAIGYPLWPELSGQATFTKGIVSAIRSTDIYDGITNEYIQINAAINPGNSGGPIVNLKGEVIGITTWSIRVFENEIWVGLNFAIPIDGAKPFIEDTIG